MKKIHLNHTWKYAMDFQEDYIQNFPGSLEVDIPHTNIELPYNNFDERVYQFISSYQKTVSVAKKPDRRYILKFEGVMAHARVYVNEKKVASHKGGYTPFSADITNVLVQGENKIFVRVDSRERKDFPPHGFVVDYLTYGGIYREVCLEEHDMNFIEDLFVDAWDGTLNIRLFFNVTTPGKIPLTFHINREGDGETVHRFTKNFDLKDRDIRFSQKAALENWDLERPILYELEVLCEGRICYRARFGCRKIEMTPQGFFLNNRPVKLRGLNRHQSYPYVGYAMPSKAQRKDADILKYELGCNVVRSSHYPPSRHFLDRCDETGLLVFNEIPGWQHVGDDSWQDIAIQNVSEMIRRDYNHPCVFIWGVRINESKDYDAFYRATNEIAGSLDRSRPTGGVRNFKGSRLFEDVYTYNDFVHSGSNRGLEKARKVAKKKVPYLVTEYNGHMYPTKKFDDEHHRIDHTKRHLKVLADAYKYKDIAGAIGWCMFDYNTHKDFGSNDRICYHGVTDMFRIPKYAASAYRMQSSHEPYLEVLSGLNIGEYEGSELTQIHVMTNADYIKFYINDHFIGDFYPSEKYPALPHAPIIIDDFIGSLIHENEPYAKKDCDRVKSVLRAVVRYGRNVPLKYKLQAGIFIFKTGKNMEEIERLYTEYVAHWGRESVIYRFEAYRENTMVASKTGGVSYKSDLKVAADDTEITETHTYEVTRIVVTHLDEHKNPLIYSNLPIEVTINGPLRMIGPQRLSLIGGSIGFWVRTTGQTGEAVITVRSHNFADKQLKIQSICNKH